MSIATRVEEIENHLVDDWNAVAGVGGDTSLDKNIENIARALDNVYDELPKVSGEGTSVTLNNTKKGRISSVLKGNTSQDTTNGKNLLNLKDTLNTTHNGISYTYNSDGSFSFSGTASSNFSNVAVNITDTIPTGNYVFSIQTALDIDIRLKIYYTDSTSTTKTISAGNTSTSFSISKEVSYCDVSLGSLTNQTSYSGTVYAMLESGSTATDFEPFTYGATPNPNYPQPIHLVSGDNTIKVVGKNLLDFSNPNSVGGSTTYTFTNDVLTISNTTGTYKAITFNITKLVKNNPGKYLKIVFESINTSSSAGTIAQINTYKRGASTTYTALINSSGVSNHYLIANNTSDISLIELKVYSNNSGTSGAHSVSITKPMLIFEGVDATYEPYQGKEYTINLGVKNLFDGNFEIGGYKTEDGTKDTSTNRIRCVDYVKVSPNTIYTLSFENEGSVYVLEYNNDKTYLNINTLVIYHTTSGSFTTSDNTEYITFYYIPYEHSLSINEKCQLEEGSKANSYTPYGTTPIELCKIGDYQDKLIRSSGKNLKDFSTITYSAQNSATVSRSGEEYTITNSGGSKWGSCRFGITATNLKPNTTYTFSALVKSTTATNGSMVLAYAGVSNTGNQINGNLATAGQRSYVTFTTPSEFDPNATKDIGLLPYEASKSAVFTDVMIEESATMTDYEPYGYGKWYKYGMINKKTLVGTEYWGSDSGVFYTWDITDYARSSNKPYANYYKGYLNASGSSSAYQKGNNSVCFNNSTSNSRFYIRNDAITTTNDFKSWLSTHNTILYYILSTPTITEITNTYLINQLNDYYNALSYQNQTNISQENADLPFEISAEALLDINTELTNLREQIEVLS